MGNLIKEDEAFSPYRCDSDETIIYDEPEYEKHQMGVKKLLNRSREDIRADGFTGANRAAYRLVRTGLGAAIRQVYSPGKNVFTLDWDVLLILDACRVDLLSEVTDEYEFLESQVPTITSVGSSSQEWIRNTFTDSYSITVAKTAYVTGNPFSDELLDPNEFLLLEEVWRYAWDDKTHTVPARPISDRLIDVMRTENPDRVIAHYMQPHATFIPHSDMQASGNQESIWMALREGEFEQETVWDAYRDNLRYVLDEVSLVLENIDADTVVISSDHGNAIGEFGIYGHPSGYPISCIREVPWVETSAVDERTYEPEIETITDDDSVEDRLVDLGYISDQRQ